MAGFFPGLGSRASYQGLGRSLFDAGVPAVDAVYREAAEALGFPGRPDRLLAEPGNLPAGRLERQGFVGAAVLVHSLALDAHLKDRAERTGAPVGFAAYTGESFGILTAAVAAGSLSVTDGVRIAQAFTPLMLLAATGRTGDEPFAHRMSRYLGEPGAARPLVPEPYHVVAVRTPGPDALAAVLDAVRAVYPLGDVELHKAYAAHQANLYVRVGVRAEFDRFMADFPEAETRDLKEPTVFLAHSARMRPVRHALERFFDLNRVRFAGPSVPVVANHGMSLLVGAADVRRGVLAMTDEVMASQQTCEVLTMLDLDAVVELGPGGRSARLLADNATSAPVTACTGDTAATDRMLRVFTVVDRLTARSDPAAPQHTAEVPLDDGPTPGATAPHDPGHDLLRELFALGAADPFCEDYAARTLQQLVATRHLSPERPDVPGSGGLLEIYQHTRDHRDLVDTAGGDLVTRARLKKHLTAADGGAPGTACVELRVLDAAGAERVDRLPSSRPEVLVVHFDALSRLGEEDVVRRIRHLLDTLPTALSTFNEMLAQLPAGASLTGTGRRIVQQYLLFDALARQRPALFAQTDHYLEGGDTTGWLAALAVSGAVSLADAVALSAAGADRAARGPLLDRVGAADIPLVAPDGVPVQSRNDLRQVTRAVLEDLPDAGPRRIHLGGNCRIVALGTDLGPVDAGAHATETVTIAEPDEAWRPRLNPALDRAEETAVLALTAENALVLATARSRRILSSTICAYLDIDESVVSFGKGGSESMTVFVRKRGARQVTVRKILSEALTTARWNPEGSGVMLPPFAKAKKQAEFLSALPAPVRDRFPEVHTVLERSLPAPVHPGEEGAGTYREVIYEMSYVAGEEVSRFVEKHSPPSAVVARLYEQIIRVLNDDVHAVGVVPAPGETLDVSYFRKIEDRLALCRRTAPRTFGADLLDTEAIVINGVRHLNAKALLRRFRETPAYLAVLEPAVHCLVMGDTNTENIKIGDTGPLLRAQHLIESGAPREETDAALAAITADSLGIRFLDPRAIGFKSDGSATRDDAMYDNKPWHNSLGHYDEIHFEHFTLDVDTGPGRTPRIDIAFLADNPYQRSYRVRDVVAGGATVDPRAPGGMEDWFAPVMTAALELDDPASPYLRRDPYWLVRFVFMMGQHFTAMPPFHFQKELDGTLTDTYQTQRRPVAIYCEGIKWLNWALQMLEGSRTEFLGLPVPPLPYAHR
ncbi:ACP S-malonyltransferase [Actinacidiphila yeochonensis]|uniref:ACP S-malonyltransferase n=1 Tax=Actinacidiphila yeochonensis TaxID=89050 RepID=UPI00055D7476|nr:ACP S-malonyltransferase [Actinacidiphila yeochonensis]